MGELASNPQWIFLVRVALAAVLGVIIGAEREIREKAAGVRTQAMVCMGAAAFALVSEYGFRDGLLPGTSTINYDLSRVAAQVATGVGFLGAGTILIHNDRIIGLTTAATIWLMAAVGLLVGTGQYILGIGSTVLALAVLELVGWLLVPTLIPHERRQLRIIVIPGADVLQKLEQEIVKAGFSIGTLRSRHENHEKEIVIVDVSGRRPVQELADHLRRLPSTREVEIPAVPEF